MTSSAAGLKEKIHGKRQKIVTINVHLPVSVLLHREVVHVENDCEFSRLRSVLFALLVCYRHEAYWTQNAGYSVSFH